MLIDYSACFCACYFFCYSLISIERASHFLTYETPRLVTFTSQIPSFCQAPDRLGIDKLRLTSWRLTNRPYQNELTGIRTFDLPLPRRITTRLYMLLCVPLSICKKSSVSRPLHAFANIMTNVRVDANTVCPDQTALGAV